MLRHEPGHGGNPESLGWELPGVCMFLGRSSSEWEGNDDVEDNNATNDNTKSSGASCLKADFFPLDQVAGLTGMLCRLADARDHFFLADMVRRGAAESMVRACLCLYHPANECTTLEQMQAEMRPGWDRVLLRLAEISLRPAAVEVEAVWREEGEVHTRRNRIEFESQRCRVADPCKKNKKK